MSELKKLIRMQGIPMWKIAECMGISEMTLYRWMRKFDPDHHEKILNAVKMILDGGENCV